MALLLINTGILLLCNIIFINTYNNKKNLFLYKKKIMKIFTSNILGLFINFQILLELNARKHIILIRMTY